MRSPADEAARYRLEVQALQRENAELKRSRTVIEGIPAAKYNQLESERDKLAAQLKGRGRVIEDLRARLSERDERADSWRESASRMAKHVTDAKGLERENEQLKAERERMLKTLAALKRTSERERHDLQCQIDELKCRLRHDNPN